MRRRNRLLWMLATVAVVMVAARAALPYAIEDYVNDRLMALESYDGRVSDVDLALWRGAYRAEDVRIVKSGVDSQTPFFEGDQVDFGVEWRNLLRGSLVARCVLARPRLNLVQAQTDRESQLGTEVNWQEQIERLFPFRFNTIKVSEGSVTFRAPGIAAADALEATSIDGLITNMTNVAPTEREAFAGFSGSGRVLGSGSATIEGRASPLARQPTFDVNITVRNVQLPKVNPWLRKYVKADAEKGDFELYAEIAAAEGRFEGYAKPVMRNVDIYSSDEEAKSALRKFWERIVDIAAEIFEDEDTEQVAARIPLRGRIENPEAGTFEAIVSVVRNAFVSAFARSLEGSISLRDVRKRLRKLGEPENGEEEKDEARDRVAATSG